jgi:hypothetical protein
MAGKPHRSAAAARFGLAMAALISLAITLAACFQSDLLARILQVGWAVPLFLGLLAAQALLAALFFVHPVRPRSTRSLKAFLWRDDWLSERLKMRHPDGMAALGGMLVGFTVAAGSLVLLAILAAVAAPALLSPLVTSFVVVAWTSVAFRIVGSGILIAGEAASASRHRGN